MRLAVVGAGAAGMAAAWQAARRGATVTVVHTGAGASALYSGALDYEPWDRRREHTPLDAAVLSFATAFDAWDIGATPARVVTDAGVVRPARGLDTALLDLEPLAGKRVAVAAAPVDGWDGPAIARAAAASGWAVETGTRFEAVPIEPPGPGPDGAIPDYDRAAYLDEEARAASFADHLRGRIGECDAMLVGPWLGTTTGTAEIVRERLGCACGETTSKPGGPAGARLERGREDLFASLRLDERRARVTALRSTPDGWRLAAEGDEMGPFEAVVLAVGGLVGGGLEMADPAVGARGRFRLGLEAPGDIELDGHLVDAASTLHGVDLQGVGMHALEAVGLRVSHGVRISGAQGLFAAGDVVAGRPRTVLQAVAMGLAAVRMAVG